MIKSIGSLHNVPGPSSDVLSESLKLLTTFGDKKAISSLLEQLREVQTHNERIFKETQAAIESLSIAKKEFEASRQAFANLKNKEDSDLNRRWDDLSQAEARLSGKMSKFDSEQASANAILSDKEADILKRAQAMTAREAKCDDRGRDLDSRLAVVGGKEADLRNREQQLQVKEKKLRAVLDGG